MCNALPEIKVERAAAAVLASALLMCPPALADLNVYEAAAGGEFGIGSAQQYGEADIQGKDFSNQARTLTAITADQRSVNPYSPRESLFRLVYVPMRYAFGSSAVRRNSTARLQMCGDKDDAAACPMCCMWHMNCPLMLVGCLALVWK